MTTIPQTIWDQKAAQGDFKGAVLAFLHHRGAATFCDIQDILSPYMQVYGDHAIYWKPYENAIFWINVSLEFATIYGSLMNERLIYARTTSPYTYVADGKVPAMPLATILEGDYAEPHWYPVALYPMNEEMERKFAGGNEVTEYGYLFAI